MILFLVVSHSGQPVTYDKPYRPATWFYVLNFFRVTQCHCSAVICRLGFASCHSCGCRKVQTVLHMVSQKLHTTCVHSDNKLLLILAHYTIFHDVTFIPVMQYDKLYFCASKSWWV